MIVHLDTIIEVVAMLSFCLHPVDLRFTSLPGSGKWFSLHLKFNKRFYIIELVLVTFDTATAGFHLLTEASPRIDDINVRVFSEKQ